MWCENSAVWCKHGHSYQPCSTSLHLSSWRLVCLVFLIGSWGADSESSLPVRYWASQTLICLLICPVRPCRNAWDSIVQPLTKQTPLKVSFWRLSFLWEHQHPESLLLYWWGHEPSSGSAIWAKIAGFWLLLRDWSIYFHCLICRKWLTEFNEWFLVFQGLLVLYFLNTAFIILAS